MSKQILKYDELVKVEKNLIKPMLENINKALKVIFEGKKVKLLGSDFDKNLFFYVGSDFKTAQWSLSEDKIKISDIKDVEIEVNSFNTAFTDMVVEAIDLIANEKLSEAEDKIGDAIKLKITEKTTDKLSVFSQRPIIKEARKHLVKVGRFVTEKKDKESLKPLVEKLQTILESFLGKTEKSEKGETFEFSILEGKATKIEESEVRTATLLKNITIAKQEALKLAIKPILEHTATFISEHEELFLLKSDVIRKKLEEATKQDISITKERIDETIKLFNEMRSKSDSFKSLVKQVISEDDAVPYAGEETQGEPERETDLNGDAAVDALDQEESEEKLGFMKQFVDILVEIFEKIREVSEDDGDITNRVNNALNIIKRNQEEGKWDKEELSEIAREAIELAAKVEGIEPEDTEISKRSEEDQEDQEMDRETISSQGQGNAPVQKLGESTKIEAYPAIDQPAQEIVGNYNYNESEEEVEPTDDVTISPDGEITYGDDEMEDIPELDMDTYVCQDCEREFNAETGEDEYHCPYCGEMVSGDLGEEPIEGEPEIEEPVIEPSEEPIKDESGPAADQPGQEIAGNVAYHEDVEDDMKANDKRELILGDEDENAQRISDKDFAGKLKKKINVEENKKKSK